MSQNKEAENLDDIFLIKDKNKPKYLCDIMLNL